MDILKSFENLHLLVRGIDPEKIEVSEIFKNCILKSSNSEDFYKSWSSDLKQKFPSGDWRTVNGAKVFINNGKVVAGLDGFNGEIDKFFKEKESKKGTNFEVGDIVTDKNGDRLFINKIENGEATLSYVEGWKGYEGRDRGGNKIYTESVANLTLDTSKKQTQFKDLAEQLTSRIAVTDDKPLKELDKMVSNDPTMIPQLPKQFKDTYLNGKNVLIAFRSLKGDKEDKYKELDRIDPNWESKYQAANSLINRIKVKKIKNGFVVDGEAVFNVTNVNKNTVQVKDRYSDKEVTASKQADGNIDIKLNGKQFKSMMSLTESTEMDDNFVQVLVKEFFLS